MVDVAWGLLGLGAIRGGCGDGKTGWISKEEGEKNSL